VTGSAEYPHVYVRAADTTIREAVTGRLRLAGVTVVAGGDPTADAVVLAAGRTVDEALDACPPRPRAGDYRLLVAAEVLSPADAKRAFRAGARTLLRTAEMTPDRLAAIVRSARHGEGRLPYGVLVGLLRGTAERGGSPAPHSMAGAGVSPLTARQTAVLTLVADGHGNTAIADALSCSQHTVKNVIYDLMARLQVRNRTHAVAHAVRAGLI